jgi:hypothetical protein
LTFVWSCNNGPRQAFSGFLAPLCADNGGVALNYSPGAPFDSTCYGQVL